MKVDMNLLMGSPRKRRRRSHKKLIMTTVTMACCLFVFGGSVLVNEWRQMRSVSADELYTTSLADPAFIVQHMADITLPDVQEGEGDITVLMGNGGGRSISFDENGMINMRTERMSLYTDEATRWFETATLEQMVHVDPASMAYGLKEIWIGLNPVATVQSDFTVAEINDPADVIFTNNTTHPELSRVENGYYRPNENGQYVIPITEGSVVRLIYGEKSAQSSTDVWVYDYDITDGGFYDEDRVWHESSEAAGWTESMYVETVRSGINSDENYQGNGAKFAFGANGADTGLANEQNELGTFNVFNAAQKDRVGNTGVTMGLIKTLNAAGEPVWNVNAPALFSGDALESSAKFLRKGTNYILTTIGSAEGLEKHGTSAWFADDAPSFATDGHDVAWGETDVRFYRDGSLTPEKMPAGAEHNRYFGVCWTKDFVLEPGYVGPLNVFGVSDDDLWVMAARVDTSGNVIQNTVTPAIDLGGVHDTTGYWYNLWNSVSRVQYGDEAQVWRLFVFWLERDGQRADFMLSYNLPESGVYGERETGMLTVEAAGEADGTQRSFVLTTGGHNYYKVTHNNGHEALITAGEPFAIENGTTVTITGMNKGANFRVQELDRENVWHTAGGEYKEGDTAKGTVGHEHHISFKSAPEETAAPESSSEQPLLIELKQSVTSDWGTDDVSVRVGDMISYCIVVTNESDHTMDVTIEDILSDKFNVMTLSVNGGSIDGQTIRWDLALAAGEAIELSFTCQVNAAGDFGNAAIMMAGSDPALTSNIVRGTAV